MHTKRTETDDRMTDPNNIKGSNDPDFSLRSVAGPISFGLCMGACAGVASKKVTKAAATLIGVSFIALQVIIKILIQTTNI